MIQPVTMVPLRRCGSHALRLRLSASPDFYSPYPLHLVDFLPLVPLYGDLTDDATYFQLTLDLLGLQSSSLVKWDGLTFDPIRFFDEIKAQPRSPHTIAWTMLMTAARQRGARVVMDKSLDNVHAWPELLQLYPNMLFINLVRDPRAQVSSMNRAIIHEFDTLLNARILVDAFEAVQRLIAAHPDRVVTIRFEDFIADEGRVVRQLCDFLALRFLPEMLQIELSAEAARIARQSALWESNSSPPIKANVDKFRATLSPLEIEQIETLAGSVMATYGYETMTDARAEITASTWTEARRRGEERKAKAWEDLRRTKPQDYMLRRYRSDFIEGRRQRLLLAQPGAGRKTGS